MFRSSTSTLASFRSAVANHMHALGVRDSFIAKYPGERDVFVVQSVFPSDVRDHQIVVADYGLPCSLGDHA
jgi:hypothetical protein